MDTLISDWRLLGFIAVTLMSVGAAFWQLRKVVDELKMSDGKTIATHLELIEQKVDTIERRQDEIISDQKREAEKASVTSAKLWTAIDECKNDINRLLGMANGQRR